MVPTKPYLIRAIFEWCVDQGFTPYVSVAVDARTRVPREFVRDGQIVLNVGREATHQLHMGNDEITFQARFNGVAFPVYVPVDVVTAVYARENGQGMAFEAITRDALVPESPATEARPEPSPDTQPPTSSGRPKLTRVK
jgi:stringent starvation protein B